MQKTNRAAGDSFNLTNGYTLDGMTFGSWPQARDYLVGLGYSEEEATSYLDLLDADCMRKYRERCFA